jgi:hypothetical protein
VSAAAPRCCPCVSATMAALIAWGRQRARTACAGKVTQALRTHLANLGEPLDNRQLRVLRPSSMSARPTRFFETTQLPGCLFLACLAAHAWSCSEGIEPTGLTRSRGADRMSAIALFRSFRAYAPRPPPPPPRRRPPRAPFPSGRPAAASLRSSPIPNIAAYPAPEAAGASSS